MNRRGPRTPISQVFTFLACMLVLWNLNFFVSYAVADREVAMSLTRVLHIGGIFVPPAILHVVFVLRDHRPRWWRNALLIDYAFSFALLIPNALDLFISDLRQFAWGYHSVGTRLYDAYTVVVIGNFLAAIAALVHDYRVTTEPRLRLQLEFWLLGATVALPLGLTNLLPVYGVPFYPLGNLGSAAWASIVAYAIVRHRLMDIDVVVTKGAAYAAVALLLIGPAFTLMLWIERLSFGRIHPDFSFALLVMFVAVGVLFPTLRVRAQSRIERSLFREKHEHRATLSAFARTIVRILDRDKLLRELADTLTVTLQLERLAVYLPDGEDRSYTVSHAKGGSAPEDVFADNDPFVVAIQRRDEPVLRYEIEASDDPAEHAAAEICRRNSWEVCIPLAASGRLLGFICLGRKRNLDAFSVEDLHLLDTLAAEAAIALENARLYGELKKSRDIIERTGRLSAMGTLAAGIAHEIRNPLVSVQTFFQLAPQRIHDQEFFTGFLNLTAAEVQRISDLITELLSFAKSPAHKIQGVDLNDLIERTTKLLEPEARKQRIKLVRMLALDLPAIRADSDQVKQIVINLVLNAIQATTPSGSVTVFTRRSAHQGKPFCQIEVRDTGIGIPQRMIEDIFNPFFTTKEKGTGLGLSIAHQLATEHGGFITVASEEGRGSSFYINLPEGNQAVFTAEEAEIEADLPLRYGRMAKL
ncbi:MAG: GAF domain-containing protein [Deltaproteobacteria bacterium]|nr:GAF domain-containing protein [Deltaproteobacteria bacterium]